MFAKLFAPTVDVSAHCDLPCGVYDPAQARIEAESIKAIIAKVADNDDPDFRTRAVLIKEQRSELVQSLEEGQVIQVPVNHNEGNWTAGAESLQVIEDQRLVAFRYCDAEGRVTDAANPNGAVDNVAGILNEKINVLGMMPHPERVCEEAVGGTDGRAILQSMIDHVRGG